MTPVWFSALVCAVALAMAVWETRNYVLGEASKRWRRTEGKVLDAWFELDEHSGEDALIYFGEATDSHVARLVYEYFVDGRRYRSRHFTYRPTRHRDARKVFALLREFRVGNTVQVRYDPKRPQRAVVLPGADEGSLLRILGWGVLALFAAGFALVDPTWL